MTVSNNTIEINGILTHMGMAFADASMQLKDEVYVQKAPDEKGLGHIIVKDVEFYGLRGKCTLYFQEGVLKQMSLTPAWNRYDLNDAAGKRLPIDQAVEKIARASVDGLRNAFGIERERSEYGNLVFTVGEFYIVTSVARSGDSYSVTIK